MLDREPGQGSYLGQTGTCAVRADVLCTSRGESEPPLGVPGVTSGEKTIEDGSRDMSTNPPRGMLDGKVAFITGGASGMGRAAALTLAREGADIVIADLLRPVETAKHAATQPDDLEQTMAAIEAMGRRVLGRQADVRLQEQLDSVVGEAIDAFGQVDILFANAGTFNMGKYWELTEDEWGHMINIDLSGVWRSAKAVTPHMIEREQGSIIFNASTQGLAAGGGYAHYVAAKHGVIGFMKSAAAEVGRFNIRCNAVCPGFVNTKLNDWQEAYDVYAGGEGGVPEDRVNVAAHSTALAHRNLLAPQSVANAVLYLASDLSADVTGIALTIDAGMLVLPGYNPDPVR